MAIVGWLLLLVQHRLVEAEEGEEARPLPLDRHLLLAVVGWLVFVMLHGLCSGQHLPSRCGDQFPSSLGSMNHFVCQQHPRKAVVHPSIQQFEEKTFLYESASLYGKGNGGGKVQRAKGLGRELADVAVPSFC